MDGEAQGDNYGAVAICCGRCARLYPERRPTLLGTYGLRRFGGGTGTTVWLPTAIVARRHGRKEQEAFQAASESIGAVPGSLGSDGKVRRSAGAMAHVGDKVVFALACRSCRKPSPVPIKTEDLRRFQRGGVKRVYAEPGKALRSSA